MEDWLQVYQDPADMNYICVANAGMSLGVTNALASANRSDDFLITSVDLSDSGVDMVKDGLIDALVGAPTFTRGYLIVDLALELIDGTYTEKTYSVMNPWILDATNYQDFLDFRYENLGY